MPSRVIDPIRTRSNLSVANPTEAVILRTCRFFPSVIVIDSQLVGPCRASSRMVRVGGGIPGGNIMVVLEEDDVEEQSLSSSLLVGQSSAL